MANDLDTDKALEGLKNPLDFLRLLDERYQPKLLTPESFRDGMLEAMRDPGTRKDLANEIARAVSEAAPDKQELARESVQLLLDDPQVANAVKKCFREAFEAAQKQASLALDAASDRLTKSTDRFDLVADKLTAAADRLTAAAREPVTATAATQQPETATMPASASQPATMRERMQELVWWRANGSVISAGLAFVAILLLLVMLSWTWPAPSRSFNSVQIGELSEQMAQTASALNGVEARMTKALPPGMALKASYDLVGVMSSREANAMPCGLFLADKDAGMTTANLRLKYQTYDSMVLRWQDGGIDCEGRFRAVYNNYFGRR